MKQSTEIDQLAAALVAIQSEVPAIPKGAENPFFKSKYADLAAVVELASPIVTNHGIAVSQDPDFDGTNDLLTTTLLHVSGQWKSASARLHLPKADPQGQGSAITYMKRYAYMAALGLVAEPDDDGQAASGSKSRSTSKKSEAPRLVTAADAKHYILEAVKGDTEVAKAVWGDRGSNPIAPVELDQLIASATYSEGPM